MLLIFILIVFVVYMIVTKDKRAEEREKKRKELELMKQNMSSDPTIALIVEEICKNATDLKSAPVSVLRAGGTYWMIFDKGSVYYETRWTEKIGDSFERRKNTQCILNRMSLGKNPLSHQENRIFAAIVCDKLSEFSWMSISNNGDELRITKSENATIPEAF